MRKGKNINAQKSSSNLKILLFFTLGGIIIFGLACCFCIFLYNLGDSQTPESTSSKPRADITLALPPKSTITPSWAASPTSPLPLPTLTLTPAIHFQTPTTEQYSDLIADFSVICDSHISEVEKLLGDPVEIIPMGIGGLEEIPDGGESRAYMVGKYKVCIDYNKMGIAKGLQVEDGLEDDGYSLDQYPLILSRIGADFLGGRYVGNPDVVGDFTIRWTNASGYGIMLGTNSYVEPVWTVLVYKIHTSKITNDPTDRHPVRTPDNEQYHPDHPLIADFSVICDSHIDEVEKVLGTPIEITAMGIGSIESLPDGGESRAYMVGKYKVEIDYDKMGIAKGLQVTDGLEDDGYSLVNYYMLLDRIGVSFPGGEPDIVAPLSLRWTNAFGYAISIWAKPGGIIWSASVYKIP